MTLKTKFFIISLVFLSLNTYSQIRYETGYFVNNDGDRIDCLIKNVDWKNNPTKFSYKLSETSEAQIGTIETVQEFGVADFLKFKRYEVDIDRTSDDITTLTIKRTPEFKKEVLFLKTLVEGEANLFFYEKGNLRRFFYSTNDLQISQLVFMKYMMSMGEKKVGVNNEYKYQLWQGLKCKAITNKDLNNTGYKKNNLVDYFVKYNSCKKSNYKLFKKKGKTDLNLSIKPQSSFYTFDYFGSGLGAEINIENALGIGLELEFSLPFNKNKWSLFVMPSYETFKGGAPVENEYINPYGTWESQIDYAAIEIPLGIRHYFFLSDKSKLYMNAGGAIIGFDLASKIKTVRKGSVNTYRREIEIDGAQEYFFLGGGYSFNNKFNIEFRYKFNRDLLANYHIYKSQLEGYSIMVGYNLF